MSTTLATGRYQTWRQWRQVIHGHDALDRIPGELARLGATRALVVTNPSLLAEGSVLATVTNVLGDAIVGTFGAATRGAPRAAVLAATAAARACEADVLVSLGGGSVVDTAKGVALCTAFAVDSAAALDPLRVGTQAIGLTSPVLPAPPIPIIAVPTTLSGAEYTGMIGITDELTGDRDPYRFDALAPDTVVLDPRATTATPARLWGATGIKALSDAFEQYVSATAGPAFEPQLVEAVRLLATGLVPSVDGDVDARMRCQLGGWLTMFATFNVGSRVGIGAALRHQLGRRSGMPHGEATCPMLGEVVRRTCPDDERGHAMLAATSSLRTDRGAAAESGRAGAIVADRLVRLVATLGLPTSLTEAGLSTAEIGELADHVVGDFANRHRTTRVWTADEVREMLAAAT